uniref:hypothetical protein n=1 Tax=Microvirga aerophila TaxID=670291 RepID=UPI001AECEEC4
MVSPDTYDGVHPNLGRDVERSRRAMGKTQPDHGIGIDLQNATAFDSDAGLIASDNPGLAQRRDGLVT